VGRRTRRHHRCKRGPESVDVSVQLRDLDLELRSLISVATGAVCCRFSRSRHRGVLPLAL
jgi:hypothetical protein